MWFYSTTTLLESVNTKDVEEGGLPFCCLLRLGFKAKIAACYKNELKNANAKMQMDFQGLKQGRTKLYLGDEVHLGAL